MGYRPKSASTGTVLGLASGLKTPMQSENVPSIIGGG